MGYPATRAPNISQQSVVKSPAPAKSPAVQRESETGNKNRVQKVSLYFGALVARL